jgi:HK97 family phage major capsid protein
MSKREIKGYSMMRAIRSVADNNWNQAGLELEAHKEIAKRTGAQPDPNKFFVPLEVQNDARIPQVSRNHLDYAKRDMTVGTTTAGGFLVETQNIGFIEMLRNRSVTLSMGAQRLTGLVGNVSIPRQTAAATAVWLATEASTLTESQQTLGQLVLTPKTVGGYTEISRQLLIQSSPDAEGIVTGDLAMITALAVDLAALEGTGASGQPTGIANTGGIGSFSGTSLGYAGIIECQTDVASGNVKPVSGGYVTTPSVAGLLKQRQRFSSTDTPVWGGNIWDGSIEGFPAMSSNQLTAATMIFGDWNKVVVAEWSVLEIEVNPFANFQAGIVGVRAMYTVDVGVRYPIAFTRGTTIT